jgi:hypothetical protein
MSHSSKNRVTSSKTPRGSQNPHGYAGYEGIVQRSRQKTQRTIGVEEIQRILAIGKLLLPVLTPGERARLTRLIRSGIRDQHQPAFHLDTGGPRD